MGMFNRDEFYVLQLRTGSRSHKAMFTVFSFLSVLVRIYFLGNQSPSVAEPVLFGRSRCKGPASALLAFRERPGCELKSVGIDRLVGGPKVGIAVACGVHRAGGGRAVFTHSMSARRVARR